MLINIGLINFNPLKKFISKYKSFQHIFKLFKCFDDYFINYVKYYKCAYFLLNFLVLYITLHNFFVPF